MARYRDLTGKKFNRLTVLKEVGRDYEQSVLWLCKCDCGNETVVSTKKLNNGHTKSCGCLHREKFIYKTHGKSNTRIYKIWAKMLERCNNPKTPAYKNYGGRGITYQDSWKDFNNFYEDMYESYKAHCKECGEKETTLDRINVNGNYTKENCRWATRKEQANNTRTNIIIDGVTMAQYAEIHNINYNTLQSRLWKERNGDCHKRYNRRKTHRNGRTRKNKSI